MYPHFTTTWAKDPSKFSVYYDRKMRDKIAVFKLNHSIARAAHIVVSTITEAGMQISYTVGRISTQEGTEL